MYLINILDVCRRAYMMNIRPYLSEGDLVIV